MEDTMNSAQEAAGRAQGPFLIKRRFRYWEVIDPRGELVCLTVYKRGAVEVVRRLYN
jgi:hypothetical protein